MRGRSRSTRRSRQDRGDLRRLAQRAHKVFQAQPAREKRKLIDCVLAGSGWKDGRLLPEWPVPFGEMARAA